MLMTQHVALTTATELAMEVGSFLDASLSTANGFIATNDGIGPPLTRSTNVCKII